MNEEDEVQEREDIKDEIIDIITDGHLDHKTSRSITIILMHKFDIRRRE